MLRLKSILVSTEAERDSALTEVAWLKRELESAKTANLLAHDRLSLHAYVDPGQRTYEAAYHASAPR